MNNTANYCAEPEALSFGGLLARHRRRDGRSQLHLALDAGISSRHLGFLETGRSRPSAEMVVLLAGTLNLSAFEQNEMLLSAGFAPQPLFGLNANALQRPTLVGSHAFETAVAIAGAQSAADAVEHAERFFRQIGIYHFMTGTLRKGTAGWEIARDPVGSLATGWLRHIEMNGYRDKDYLVAATATASQGFFWSDIPRSRLTSEQCRIIDEASEYGICNGFVMPVQMSDGSVRAFSSWSERIEPDVATRTAAGLVASALLESIGRLKVTAMPTNIPVRLKVRHYEVLSRIAEGCTAKHIAHRLSLPEQEALEAITSATSAMGCSSPAHAASRALSLGLIDA